MELTVGSPTTDGDSGGRTIPGNSYCSTMTDRAVSGGIPGGTCRKRPRVFLLSYLAHGYLLLLLLLLLLGLIHPSLAQTTETNETDSSTGMPTAAPILLLPSVAPTSSAPTAAATLQPTAFPTTILTVNATVVLALYSVTTEMSPVHRNYFGPQLAAYLETALEEFTPFVRSGWTGHLESQLLWYQDVPGPNRRVRHLQQGSPALPLATRTVITITQNSNAPPLSPSTFSFYIQQALQADAAQGFLETLTADTVSPTLLVFFDQITSAVVYPADADITSGNGGKPQNTPSEDDDELENDDNDDDGLGLWVIVGIVAGAGVCLICIAVILMYTLQPETVLNSPRSLAAAAGFSTSSRASHKASRGGNASDDDDDREKPYSSRNNNNSRGGSYDANSDDDDDGEDDTTYMANASVLNPPTVTAADDDNQSYAYSLEAGHTVTTSRTKSRSTVVPPPSRRRVSSNRRSSRAVEEDDEYDNDANTTAQATMMTGATSKNVVTRQLQAPPGKLGLIIDTSLAGPIVHRVNENSPLVHQIFPGDIITSINNIDTRAMKASAITQIMMRTAHEPRVLTVVSDDVTMK